MVDVDRSQCCCDLFEAWSGDGLAEVRHRTDEFVAAVPHDQIVGADTRAKRFAGQLQQSVADQVVKHATTDELTGARTRRFGLEEMSHELERAHRTGGALVLAFVDVDGLKQVNDDEGHLAGDALLKLVGETIRASVRPYDLVVRYGGDEFVCAMSNISVGEGRARFERIADALAAVNPEHSVTFGIAEADPGDGLQELLARADGDLLEARRADH